MTRKTTMFATALIAATVLVAADLPASAQGWGGGQGMGQGMGMGRADAPWRERFTAIDVNNDGIISTAEMTSNAGAVFDVMDADSSGTITREEYMTVRLGAQQGWNKARQTERQTAKAARFAPMDANRDGKVDRAEFIAGAESRFKEADRNRDGRVTPAEFRSRAW